MCARMYDDVRADVQVSWARMYSRFAWVYTDVRADVHPNRTILYFLLYIQVISFLDITARLRPSSPLPRRTGGLSLGALGYGGFVAVDAIP